MLVASNRGSADSFGRTKKQKAKLCRFSRPEPVGQSQGHGHNHNQGVVEIHLCEQGHADEHSEGGKYQARWEAKACLTRLLSAQDGNSCADRCIVEQSRYGGKSEVPLKATGNGEGPEAERPGKKRYVGSPETRVNRGKDQGQVALFRQGESDSWHGKNFCA